MCGGGPCIIIVLYEGSSLICARVLCNALNYGDTASVKQYRTCLTTHLPGTGEPTDAIDYYSRGVAALEEGIACDVYEVGE